MKSTVPYYNKLSIKLRIIPWENTYLITAVTDFCRWFGSLLHGVSTLCNRRSVVLLWFVTGTSVPFCFGWNLSSTVPDINCCIKLSRTYPSKFRCGHGARSSRIGSFLPFILNYKNMVNCFFFPSDPHPKYEILLMQLRSEPIQSVPISY